METHSGVGIGTQFPTNQGECGEEARYFQSFLYIRRVLLLSDS